MPRAVSRILGAIYEEDFLPSSDGSRPHIGAKDAVRNLRSALQGGRYGYVVEAESTGFCANIDHQWMMRMLERRIEDAPLLRLSKKGLKAGRVEEDGQGLHPVTGTPQGGSVSPIVANVYLHYALDLWWEKVVKKESQGAISLWRYADDCVCLFQYKEDAERFFGALAQRLGTFKLALAQEKTRIMRCSRFHRGTSFDFLGFTFRWEESRKGNKVIKCRTSRKKLHGSIANFTAWCRAHRSVPLRKLLRDLNAKLRGYDNYYGIIGNYDSLRSFFTRATTILWKWVNRRSQKRSYTWQQFEKLLKHYRIARPRITDTPQTPPVLSLAFR